MSFPRDAYPYTNFHELNLGYFIVHFREIFSQWANLYDQMLNWKDATDEELATWKAGVEADLDQREAALRAELETWKALTGQDIAGWEDATLAALTAWQTATQAVFEAIRVEAAGSASAAAASAGDAATAKTAAETAQAAAEAAAASVQASAAQITTNTEDIADLKTQMDDTFAEITTEESKSIPETVYYETPWNIGGGINADGNLVEVSSWAYTNKIPVIKGDVVTCDALDGSLQRFSRPIRYLCAYNGDIPVPSAGYSSEISSYTVPDGITHIVVTQASFTTYTGQRVIINRTVTTRELWVKQDKIGGFRQSGNLGDGDEFVFPITNIKEYKVFTFGGTITSFSSLILGRHVDDADNESVKIDATNITITNTYGAETVVAHGLTIAENIQVFLKTGNINRLESIRITTQGNTFEYTALTNLTWNGDKGYPFVRSVGSVLTDCAASWTSRKMNAPIWIFGDSYMTYDTARWAYYLIQDGYDDNALLNAYAGENSQNALVAFNSLISGKKRPNIIVWALGMNDGDSAQDDAPNGNWLNTLNTIKSVCEARGIELILCTIPTTPLINNNYKNAYVKASGYRYIDFAAGVGATTAGVWFTGLLSQDNVHPTVEGAKTLYYKLLSELPEIVTNN